MSFSLSLSNNEFNRLKKGPIYGTDNDCAKDCDTICMNSCLKIVDYSVAWARINDQLYETIFPSTKYKK